jgi:hypothetical protein
MFKLVGRVLNIFLVLIKFNRNSLIIRLKFFIKLERVSRFESHLRIISKYFDELDNYGN